MVFRAEDYLYSSAADYANATRYNRAGAGEVNFAAFITGHFQMVENDSLLKSGIRGYVELNAICTNRS